MDAAQDLLGRTLSGRFQVTAFIGEGAMANVYRAVDLAAPSPREIALKVMHPHLTMDRTFVSRFRREAKAAQIAKAAGSFIGATRPAKVTA